MRDIVAVGFGDAHVECNGKVVWRELPTMTRFQTMQTFENMAAKHPRQDWRVILDGPLHGETYQRHGRKKWVLVQRNEGFA